LNLPHPSKIHSQKSKIYQDTTIKMPFFPQAYLSPEPTLFQILSALDQPQGKSCVRRHTPQTFTPRFDITEVAEAYELYGEVPGLEQDGLTIEFSDAQTLVIKGKTQRGTHTPTSTPAAETSQPESSETASEKSHTATVEDEYDEADTPLATPATTSTATAANDAPAETTEAPTATPKPKYWVAERRVGEFARSFTFEQRIEQDFVHASLKNGILHVVVPKSQKSKKVVVSVN